MIVHDALPVINSTSEDLKYTIVSKNTEVLPTRTSLFSSVLRCNQESSFFESCLLEMMRVQHTVGMPRFHFTSHRTSC